MRWTYPSLVLVFISLTSLHLWAPTTEASTDLPNIPMGIEASAQMAVSEEIVVFPEPDAWVNDPRIVISIRISDESFDPDLPNSRITLDGELLTLNWNPMDRIVSAEPMDELSDGPHFVSVLLLDRNSRTVNASWPFNLDTLPPIIDLDPLPEVASERVLSIRGRYIEENLKEIKVNSFTAITEENTFSVPVLLWPGRNSIEAVAIDKAGNRGLGRGVISWLPHPEGNRSYEPFVHPNSSFIIRLPAAWEIHQDYIFETGFRADVAAFGSVEGSFRPTISVASRIAGQTINEGLFLGLMEDAIVKLGEGAKLTLVSGPESQSMEPGLLSAQFSVIQTLPKGSRAFVLVTGLWSEAVGRIWMIVGSTPVERVEDDWHALQTAVESFVVVEPISPPLDFQESVGGAITRATLVTAGAIVFIIAISVAALYPRKMRKRKKL